MKKILFTASVFLVSFKVNAQTGLGVGVSIPQERLDVDGAIRLGNTLSTNSGTIRWNGTNFQGYNGSQWLDLDVQANANNTLDAAYDEGGAGVGREIVATDGSVEINGTDGFLVTGTLNVGQVAPNLSGSQMYFNPRKAAFRAGESTSGTWSNLNTGHLSAAFGQNTQADGPRSFAIGLGTTASNNESFAGGNGSTASGPYSFSYGLNTEASTQYSSAFGRESVASGAGAMATGQFSSADGGASFTSGFYTEANGDYSNASGENSVANGHAASAFGVQNTAHSRAEFVAGQYATNYTAISANGNNANDRLFVIGNGTSDANRFNALTITKSKRVGINTDAPDATLHVYGPNTGATIHQTSSGLLTYTMRGEDDTDAKYFSIQEGLIERWRFGMEANATNDFVVKRLPAQSNPSELMVQGTTGHVGIGTDNPVQLLTLAGTPGTDGIMFPDGTVQTTAAGSGGADTDWTISGGNQYSGVSGNVGIGTNSPSAKLDVEGTFQLVDGNEASGKILTSDASGNASWQSPSSTTNNTLDEAYDQGGAGTGRQIDASDGAVRINGDDGFIVTGTISSGDAIEVTGAGTRMFFNPN